MFVSTGALLSTAGALLSTAGAFFSAGAFSRQVKIGLASRTSRMRRISPTATRTTMPPTAAPTAMPAISPSESVDEADSGSDLAGEVGGDGGGVGGGVGALMVQQTHVARLLHPGELAPELNLSLWKLS